MIIISQIKSIISDYIDYFKKNIPLTIKALLLALILAGAPLLALVVRIGGSNAGTIITVGLIFEILTVVAFWFLIKKEYNTDKPLEIGKKQPNKKTESRNPQEIQK